jgi:hypothetical protein
LDSIASGENSFPRLFAMTSDFVGLTKSRSADGPRNLLFSHPRLPGVKLFAGWSTLSALLPTGQALRFIVFSFPPAISWRFLQDCQLSVVHFLPFRYLFYFKKIKGGNTWFRQQETKARS